ncbi:hypothetical protein RQP46_001637 [Phenoliferia psychrophenolica]
MPNLPSELVAHILDLAVPSPSFGTNSERTTLLKILALLAHDWLPFAQSHLYDTILLHPAPDFMSDPDRAAQRLVATLRASPHLARLVRVLRFRKGRGKRGPRRVPAERLEIPALLSLCVGLEEISTVEIEGVQLAWLSGSSSPKLRSLMMHETTILPRDTDALLHFPHLATLELSSEYPDRTAYTSFPFEPSALPSLRDVRVSRCVFPNLLRNAATFPLASLSLSFENLIYASEFEQLSLPCVLWDFTTPAELWGSRPYLVPGRGETIRYIPPRGGSHELFDWKRELLHCLACPAKLNTILLPDWLRDEPWLRADMEGFLALCNKMGVAVVFEYQGRPFEAPRISTAFKQLRERSMKEESDLLCAPVPFECAFRETADP